MKRPEISFRHCEGSGPLSVYWHPAPYGDAVEAKSGVGVGWFAVSGELLGVEFDDVAYERDKQALTFAAGERVEVQVTDGAVNVVARPPRRRVA